MSLLPGERLDGADIHVGDKVAVVNFSRFYGSSIEELLEVTRETNTLIETSDGTKWSRKTLSVRGGASSRTIKLVTADVKTQYRTEQSRAHAMAALSDCYDARRAIGDMQLDDLSTLRELLENVSRILGIKEDA